MRYLVLQWCVSYLSLEQFYGIPHSVGVSLLLEQVQRKFLRFAGFHLGIMHFTHNHTPVATQLGLESLAKRRRIFNLTFLNSNLVEKVEVLELLVLIHFKVQFFLSSFLYSIK